MRDRKCDVCGRKKDATHRIQFVSKANCYLCEKHRKQLARHGKFTDITPATIKDHNDFIIENDCAKIIIRNNKQEIKAVAIIDKEDVDRCKNIKWHLNSEGYVHGKSGRLPLHKFILNYYDNLPIDHINQNKLDNRKSNLRVATVMINNQNRSCVGVSFDKHANKWKAEYQRCNKYFYFGLYDSKEEAMIARAEAIKEVDKSLNLADIYKEEEHFTGISPSSHKKWRARFCRDGKVICIGTFDTKEEAMLARVKAIEEYDKREKEASA